MSIATDDPTDQDLERHLRRAFAQSAAQAPLSHPDAPIFDPATALAAGPRPASHVLLAAAASLVLIAAGIVALAHRPAAPTQSTSSTPFVPDGIEYPLVETAPNERTALGRGNTSQLVAPGVLWAATSDATFAVYRQALYFGGPQLSELTCVTIDDDGHASGCFGIQATPAAAPPEMTGPVRTGSTDAPIDVWLVPDRVAYVTFRSGTRRMWQATIGGVVAVPSGSDSLMAFNRWGESRQGGVDDSFDGPPWWDKSNLDNLGAAENNLVGQAGLAALRSCLELADLINPYNTPPDGQDADEVWRSCIAEANTAAGGVFDQLDGEQVPRPGEDPSNLGSVELPPLGAAGAPAETND